jgi:hypothetical protein
MPHGSEWLIVFLGFVLFAALLWWVFRPARPFEVSLRKRRKRGYVYRGER